jgi:outer membrane protein OmpA-like peptidoglycan-associated protein
MKLMKSILILLAIALATGCASSKLDRRTEEMNNRAAGLEVRQTEEGVAVRLPETVLFEFDKAALRSGAGAALDRSATLLRRSDKQISVEGHTDNVGTAEYNKALSEARAKVVHDALRERGISTQRLRARGYAATRPDADNGTSEGRMRNRRTEIYLIGESVDTILGPVN